MSLNSRQFFNRNVKINIRIFVETFIKWHLGGIKICDKRRDVMNTDFAGIKPVSYGNILQKCELVTTVGNYNCPAHSWEINILTNIREKLCFCKLFIKKVEKIYQSSGTNIWSMRGPLCSSIKKYVLLIFILRTLRNKTLR